MSKILLFIPMYNCEKQILRVLSQINDQNKHFFSEIIIINNCSTDFGEEVILQFLKTNTNFPIKLLKNEHNYGLGGSHKIAFEYAIKNNFDYIIVLHGDAQGDISNIIPYLRNKEYEKYDALLGSRFMKGSKLIGYSKTRTFGNFIFNLLFSIVLGFKVYDLGSGINIYKVKILKSNFYKKYKDNLTFNCFMLMAHSFYKHKIKFIPINWQEEDQVSNVKLYSQSIYTLKILLCFMLNKKNFINKEHREKIIKEYNTKIIQG